MKPTFTPLAVFAMPFLHSLVSADCMMVGEDVSAQNIYMKDPNLCTPQGEGSYTWAMGIDMVAVPTPSEDPSDGLAGITGSTGFFIMDNTCKVLGAYSPDETEKSCGIPWTIEAPWLQYVLTIDWIAMDVGGPGFGFTYANGLYSYSKIPRSVPEVEVSSKI